MRKPYTSPKSKNTDKDPDGKQQKQHHAISIAIISLVVVVVLILLTAFVWPGWATGRSDAQNPEQTSQQEKKPAKPQIDPIPLASNSSDLLAAMPDVVDSYARQAITQGSMWKSAKPLEEYAITYSTKAGDPTGDITLEVAQWGVASDAATLYASAASALEGNTVAGGKVKVSGSDTGAYEVHVNPANDDVAVALWQNDTAVFQASGPTAAVESFYKDFPL